MVAPAELYAVELGAHFTGQRMAHILNFRNTALSVPVLFEGQDRKQEIDVSLNVAHAVRAPGPELRAYVINDGNATAVQPARQPQIEIRPIDENRGYRLAAFSGTFQIAERAPEFWECASDFPKTHDRQLVGIHNRLDTGVPHLSSRRTKEIELHFRRGF